MSDDAVIEAQVAQALEGLGATWELMRIDPDFADTAAFCEKYGVAMDHSGNTIIVASKKEPKRFCACLVLATTRLDVNHAVRRLLDVSRVSFATAEETRELTGMMIGGVTLLALPPDLPIYVDDRIMALDYVILGGGSRSSKIKIAPEALRKLPGLNVVPGLAQAIP
jgi:prolyl-tRNA editing enzyme YbaK/EbsC (Cys-tRNA(Pro) deacylase)